MMSNNHYLGVQINNYTITKELASGGFGSVFLAQHNKLNRMVAIKLLLAAHLGSQQQQDQFMQEALLLDKVKHPYVLPILDVGVYTTIPYIMMEYASGGSLRDRLNCHPAQPLPPQETLAILSQVGQALQHAHQQNIIHRDIKPENILFNDKGVALLADFGIAVALSTASMKYVTSMIGTPPYMAPEQFKGTLYKESDQYALGCVAYELLTGRIPFQAPDMISMAFLHATETPASLIQLNATIPSYVEQAVLKAIAKQRADRHADMYAFVRALHTPTPVQARVQPANATPTSEAPSIPMPVIAPPPKEVKTLEGWLEDGQAHLQAKRYREALSAYEQAILLNPILAKAHNGRGDAFYGLKRYKEASRSYEEAIRLDPKDAMPYNGRGNTMKAQHNYHAALLDFEEAIKIDKQFAIAYINIGYIHYIYSIYFTNPDGLNRVLRTHLDLYKTTLFRPNIKPQESVRRRLRTQPPQPSVQTVPDEPLPSISATYQLELALEAYNTAIQINPDLALAHNGRGMIFNAQQRYPEALVELQQAIRLDPTLADAHNNMGIALRQLGMRGEALSAFRQATQINANFGDAYNNMGITLQELGKHEEAQKALQMAERLLNPHPVPPPMLVRRVPPIPSELPPPAPKPQPKSRVQRAAQPEPPRKKSFLDKLRDGFS